MPAEHARLPRRSVAPFALIMLACVALVACGEPDRSEAWGGIALDQREPLRIGLSLALTGDDTGDAQRIERGVRLALEERGTVRGWPVELLLIDDGCSESGSIAAAERFIALPAVAAVIGPMCSRGCVPASRLYEQAKLVMVTPSCTAPALTVQGYGTVLRVIPNGVVQAIAQAKFVTGELNAARVHLVDDRTVYGTDLRLFLKGNLETRGATVTGRSTVEADGSGLDATLAQITATRPDAVAFAGFLPAGRRLLVALREAGLTLPVLGPDALATGDPAALVDPAGVTYLSEVLPIEGKAYPAFARRYTDRWQEPPGPYAAQGYDAALAVLRALDKIAIASGERLTVDRRKLRIALGRIDFRGATGRVRFLPNGDRRAEADMTISRLMNATLTPVRTYELE